MRGEGYLYCEERPLALMTRASLWPPLFKSPSLAQAFSPHLMAPEPPPFLVPVRFPSHPLCGQG